MPTQFKINEAVNKDLDNDDMQQCSCGDVSDFNDYTQLATVTVQMKFLRQDISTLPAVWEKHFAVSIVHSLTYLI